MAMAFRRTHVVALLVVGGLLAAIVTGWLVWFTSNVVTGEDLDEAIRIQLALSTQTLLPELPADWTEAPRGFGVYARGPHTDVVVYRVTDSREQEAFLSVVRDVRGRVARKRIVVSFFKDAIVMTQHDSQGRVTSAQGKAGDLLRTEMLK
jgi:hypothetical protein